MKIDNFTFSPPSMTVSKGTEVTWTNQDDIPHTIGPGTIGARSKALDTGNTFTDRFDRVGRSWLHLRPASANAREGGG